MLADACSWQRRKLSLFAWAFTGPAVAEAFGQGNLCDSRSLYRCFSNGRQRKQWGKLWLLERSFNALGIGRVGDFPAVVCFGEATLPSGFVLLAPESVPCGTIERCNSIQLGWRTKE